MTPQTSYQPAWDDLRARYRRCWLAALCVLPTVLLDALLPHPLRWLGLLLFFGWLLGGAACLVRLNFFPCPRCRRLFFLEGEYGDRLNIVFSWRCRHCRLPKWNQPPLP